MPFFKSKKNDTTKDNRSRSSSIDSNHSFKLRTIFKSSSSIDHDPSRLSPSSPQSIDGIMSKSPSPVLLHSNAANRMYLNVPSNNKKAGVVNSNEGLSSFSHIPQKKRISTIAEDHNDEIDTSENEADFDDDDGEEYDEDTTDEEEEEDHLHPIKPRFRTEHGNISHHLSTLMGYCGLVNSSNLTEIANEESKSTYSLLDSHNKIHRISRSSNDKTSVISDAQVKLINSLTKKLHSILQNKDNKSLKEGKSLHDRYGVTRNLIGRGAYGVIKIIYPVSNGKTSPDLDQQLYVVKELNRKKLKEESNAKFIERILSEFVIASTLNYKHIVETIDLMINPQDFKISQIMQCSQGGDLFSYLTTGIDIKSRPVAFMSLYEVDCFIKQIAKGLKYMHNHGVSHCDLKLENILITYKQPQPPSSSSTDPKAKIILKLSDFGKSFVFQTKFDKSEQLIPTSQGPIGSLPYVAPEEYIKNTNYSSMKKDCWALGIIILVLFNIRRHYYTGRQTQENIELRYDEGDGSDGYSAGYLWQTTEPKHHHHSLSSGREYQDKVFNEYVKNRLKGDYDDESKEWTIDWPGRFRPINEICELVKDEDEDDATKKAGEGEEKGGVEEGDELNTLRVMILYKLLDIDPAKRLTVNHFLNSDWMTSTEDCC
ncbi:HAL5 [[Candida] subhashii]|uniref:HAL5 n=1 Tax=[Candida] subhashii TaxID=561895 RepID=A0A8J5V129_9ASCO|nr:HAL5 [[Candida] subhashii]KAG7664084.1 HAL5 [[Candida] subhashii]